MDKATFKRLLRYRQSDWLTKKEALQLISILQSNSLNELFPIGSIYQTVNDSFNPNDSLIGQWEEIESGLFLQASDTGAGTKVNAGVPTASGRFGAAMLINGRQSGACVLLGKNKMVFQGGTAVALISDTVSFEVQRAGGVFGKSNTVQPDAVKVKMWRRIA